MTITINNDCCVIGTQDDLLKQPLCDRIALLRSQGKRVITVPLTTDDLASVTAFDTYVRLLSAAATAKEVALAGDYTANEAIMGLIVTYTHFNRRIKFWF